MHADGDTPVALRSEVVDPDGRRHIVSIDSAAREGGDIVATAVNLSLQRDVAVHLRAREAGWPDAHRTSQLNVRTLGRKLLSRLAFA